MHIKREVLEQVMKALDTWGQPWGVGEAAKAKRLLEEALAQPEPEPVAWVYEDNLGRLVTSLQKPGNWRRETQVPLSLAPQAATPKVPEGWKLVPMEPTQNMITALLTTYVEDGLPYGYEAMLTAAPEYEKD